MLPVTDLADAKSRIQVRTGSPEEFTLAVSNALLDPIGVNMASITDCILARGWEPDGYVQHDEYRLFRYKRGGDPNLV